MKKTIAVLFAVMMMLLSAVPAFAAASPEPSTFKYKVEVIPTEGGDGDYKFTTGIDENGEQLGVMPTAKAMELAEERGLDLAKIQPTAKPPVCKLLDYDKYRYEQSRRERENRKNQRVVETKEVQLSATIEENDVLTKAKMAQKFLQGGDKVKVSIRFRGRQITHSEIGMQVMQDFAARCAEVSSVERRPMMDGRHMIMILAPKAAKASFAEKKAARENAKGNQEQE